MVGEAASGEEAVRLAIDLKPDIVLMDIFMANGDGLEATACIKRYCPDSAVLMLTSSESDEHLYRAIQNGAAGYLLKDLDAVDLFESMEAVVRGEVRINWLMEARLFKHIAHPPKDGHSIVSESLTEREIDVLQLVAQGESNPHIAQSLNISINTVKVHLRNILEKLALENRTQAAAYAVRCGLTSPPPMK